MHGKMRWPQLIIIYFCFQKLFKKYHLNVLKAAIPINETIFGIRRVKQLEEKIFSMKDRKHTIAKLFWMKKNKEFQLLKSGKKLLLIHFIGVQKN